MSSGYEDKTLENKQKKMELGLIYWCTIGMNFRCDIVYSLHYAFWSIWHLLLQLTQSLNLWGDARHNLSKVVIIKCLSYYINNYDS